MILFQTELYKDWNYTIIEVTAPEFILYYGCCFFFLNILYRKRKLRNILKMCTQIIFLYNSVCRLYCINIFQTMVE